MPLLQYDIAVIGVQNVERALSGVERRWAAHNRRIVSAATRTAAMPQMRAAARSRGTSPDAEDRGLARSFQQIARVGMSADRARYREQQALERSSHRDRLRNIERESRAATRAAAAEARAATRAQRDFRRGTGRIVGKVGESLSNIGTAALAVTGLGGGALIASRLGGAASLERRQRQLIVNARGPGEANPVEYGELQKRISTTAIATGASQEDITGGVEKFVQRTGKLSGEGGALGYLNALATASVATGSSMEDLAGVAADLQDKFDIQSPKDMANALAVLAFQGKKGAFELRDMANTFPELAAAAQRVGMKGVGGMKTLGGLAQITRSATGSGEEASTALQMALTQLVAKGADIESGKALGGRTAKVFSDKGKTQVRDIPTVLADVISGARGNLPELGKIFDQRGIRAVSPLISTYTAASQAAGGGAAGVEAGRSAVLRQIEEAAAASGTFADVQRDAADVQQSANVQLERLNTELTNSVQHDLLPALVRLIPVFQRMIPVAEKGVEALASLVANIAENPFRDIGLLIAGLVVKDIVAAQIGAKLASVLTGIAAAVAAQGGIASAGANAVMAGAGAVGSKLGLGAVGTAALGAGAAGVAAVGAVGAAGYNAYKLYEENKASGGWWKNLKEAWDGKTARGTTREEYDRIYGPHGNGPAPNLRLEGGTAGQRADNQSTAPPGGRAAAAAGAGVDRETAKMNRDAARMQLEAAKIIAGKADKPNRGNSPSPVKG